VVQRVSWELFTCFEALFPALQTRILSSMFASGAFPCFFKLSGLQSLVHELPLVRLALFQEAILVCLALVFYFFKAHCGRCRERLHRKPPPSAKNSESFSLLLIES